MAEYYMLNKPRGCISACRDARHKTVLDCFPEESRDRLFHVGRLDKDTEGLLIVTDDGRLCNDLMMPEGRVKKTYFFWALGSLSNEEKTRLEGGVTIYRERDFITSPAEIEIFDLAELRDIRSLLSEDDVKRSNRRGAHPVFSGIITITEGKKHQVKRMLGNAGCRVVYLKRVSIGALVLDNALAPGEYRELSAEEIKLLSK